ncbi:MAG: hypothetical protein ACKV2U_20450 [Bryobacteraceae bacterium]
MAVVESLAPLRAIVWVQWRISHNVFLRANKGGLAFKWLMALLWYALWVFGAAGAAFLASGRVPMPVVERALPGALFLVFFFWQLFPIILASQGAFLDMRRLLVYPIPGSQLFLLETVLRVTTAVEMILVCGGLIVGLLINPAIRLWGPIAIVSFMVLNLLLATGIKSLLERLFKKKGVRELLMLVFLGLILLPQFFAAWLETGGAPQLQSLRRFGAIFRVMPWSAAADLGLGKFSGLSVASLAAAVGIAFVFARRQFARSLQLDDSSGGAGRKAMSTEPLTAERDRGQERQQVGQHQSRVRHQVNGEVTWFDRIAGLPSALLPDPLAALVEKDIRTLFRAPRFRLIFLMASTFGTVLWLPQAIRSKDGWIAQNYISMATLYGMLVLGEALYWNVFGFERASAQQWFVTPVRFGAVLRAKNMVAVLFTLFAMAILSSIAAVLPVRVGPAQIVDALAAAAVFLVCVMAAGNLTSVYMPRPIDAEQAWRNTSGKTQFLLLFAYPILSIPIAIAHIARWAAGNYWAYHGVLGVAFLAGLCFYAVATEIAEEVAEERKERIVATLSRQDGPVSLGT